MSRLDVSRETLALMSHLNVSRETLALMSRLNVSRETLDDFHSYISELSRWQKRHNLVHAATMSEVWTRHIADCAQLVRFESTAPIWIDFGSGAGLPGLVIALMRRDDPEFHIHLVESSYKKSAFLIHVAQTLDLSVTVHTRRIELLTPEELPSHAVICARALAPPNRLAELVRPWLVSARTALLHVGRSRLSIDSEILEELKISASYHESVVGSGWILKLKPSPTN